ncbi:hypothetical protein TWF694_002058 [Orbilia ellipsospora]|uniref:Uncharacterized protein n=1 Tax=Orbilia ellipsospora TaxID=2528407 RepID=A0AAV9X5T9_9PEZI
MALNLDDLLSVEESITSLLSNSNKSMFGLTSSAADIGASPNAVWCVVSKIGVINQTLGELHKLVNWRCIEERPNNEGLKLIRLDDLKIVLLGFLFAFSNLGKSIDEFQGKHTGSKPPAWGMGLWFRKKAKIDAMMKDLEGLETGLRLILTVSRCDSRAAAESPKRRFDSAVRVISQSSNSVSANIRIAMERQSRFRHGDMTAVTLASSNAASKPSIFHMLSRVVRESKTGSSRQQEISGNSLAIIPAGSVSSISTTTPKTSLDEVDNITGTSLPVWSQDFYDPASFSNNSNTESVFLAEKGLDAQDVPNPKFTRGLYSNGDFMSMGNEVGFLNPMTIQLGSLFVAESFVADLMHRAIDLVQNDFMFDNDKDATSRVRYWIDVLRQFIEVRKDPRVAKRLFETVQTTLLELINARNTKKTRSFLRAALEFVIRFMETEDRATIDLVIETSILTVEKGMNTDHATYITEDLMDRGAKFKLSVTAFEMMEFRTLALTLLRFIELAAQESTTKAMNCVVEVFSNILDRISVQDDQSSVWIRGLLSWHGFPALVDALLSTATTLIEFETEHSSLNLPSNELLVTRIVRWLLTSAHRVGQLDPFLILADRLASCQIDKISKGRERERRKAALINVFEIARSHVTEFDVQRDMGDGVDTVADSPGTELVLGHTPEVVLSKLITKLSTL